MISFIIPAHNEQVMLHDCLSSIHQAARRCHLDYEIIVVNDSSTDNTDAVARLYHATVIPVEYRHIAATRNAGARSAKGRVLIFVDADTQISSGLVVGALKALDQGAVGGGAGLRLHGQPRWTERTAARMICFGLRLTGIAPGCFLYCQKNGFLVGRGIRRNSVCRRRRGHQSVVGTAGTICDSSGAGTDIGPEDAHTRFARPLETVCSVFPARVVDASGSRGLGIVVRGSAQPVNDIGSSTVALKQSGGGQAG